MLTVTDLHCVRSGRSIFSGVEFVLRCGTVLRIDGPNGSGKTSLLRMVCGLFQPARGTVQWHGRSILKEREAFHRDLAYLGHSNGVKDELSPLENLHVCARISGDAFSVGEASNALARFGLEGLEHRAVKWLSEGQKRRVALTRFALSKKPLWLLDEPVAALDTDAVRMVEDMFESHLMQGGMVLLTTHQDVRTPADRSRRMRLVPAHPS